MEHSETAGGLEYNRQALDLVERHFWRDIWQAVPVEVASERGVELRSFGPVQASVVRALPNVGMLNLILGAAEPGAVDRGHLAAAIEWANSQGITPYVPVTPQLPGTDAAEAWLAENGFAKGYAWMKFVRDTHPPRFRAPRDIEVIEVTDPRQEPFGMIAATGFGMPAWASTFFADLPGRDHWRCYVARVNDRAEACAAMRVDADVAEFGIAATLEPARGRGCQLALLHRRILDAREAGCRTLFVETGERTREKPSASYRNILRGGFAEAYLRPNWTRAERI
jgi:GNAT superfamily N-acetyltransferase